MRRFIAAALFLSLCGSSQGFGQRAIGPNGTGYAGPLDMLATPPARSFGLGGTPYRFDFSSGYKRMPMAGPYGGLSLYPWLLEPALDGRARLRLHLPSSDAEVWLEGKKMTQKGVLRDYYSPPLTTGYRYNYQVRVRWNQNGKVKEQTRTVTVRPDTHEEISFVRSGS